MLLQVFIVFMSLCSWNVVAERKASLVILPPLVLGHEELYEDLEDESNVKSADENDKKQTDTENPDKSNDAVRSLPPDDTRSYKQDNMVLNRQNIKNSFY